MKIFVVDDDESLRRTVVKLIERFMGDHVFPFPSALQAVGALKAEVHQNVGLILTDWDMPGMSGIELVRSIRNGEVSERVAKVPIIVMSGGRTSGDRLEALGAGADDYLAKPFQYAEMKAAFDRFRSR